MPVESLAELFDGGDEEKDALSGAGFRGRGERGHFASALLKGSGVEVFGQCVVDFARLD